MRRRENSGDMVEEHGHALLDIGFLSLCLPVQGFLFTKIFILRRKDYLWKQGLRLLVL